ncbi:hypothetical protein BDF19DRAFT_425129 [Syncephalis fuscata]|nr:hypothetical protein BDF19DRAFT_425129 [Syncephalis fuscata]
MTVSSCSTSKLSIDNSSNISSNGDLKEAGKERLLSINLFNSVQDETYLHGTTPLAMVTSCTLNESQQQHELAVEEEERKATSVPTGRLVLVLGMLPWDARRLILEHTGAVTVVRLGRTCRLLNVLVRNDAGLWQQFYEQSFLRDAQRVEHEFLEWCSEERSSHLKTKIDEALFTRSNTDHGAGQVLRSGAFADAYARLKLENGGITAPNEVIDQKIAEERSMDWYNAYRRRAATEANWCAGRYVRHNVPAPALDVRTAATLYALGIINTPRMLAGSAAGLLLLQADRLYCVYQPRSQDASFYELDELDLEAETAGVLQVRAAHMSGQWIVVELYDPEYPDDGGLLSAWRIGCRQASCAAELKEGGERVQEVRGRWALLTRRQQSATIFAVVDLEIGKRSIDELRVQCRSAELLHVDNEHVHLLVNEHVDGQRDDEGIYTDPSPPISSTQETTTTITAMASMDEETDPSLPLINSNNSNSNDISNNSNNSNNNNVNANANANTNANTNANANANTTSSLPVITCAIHCLSLDSPPSLVTSVKLPSPKRMLCRSLRIRVVDACRVLLEYIESGSFDVRVVVHRLNTSLANNWAEHAIVLISWYRRRPVVIRDCTAVWTKLNAHDAAAGYLISPSLGTLMDMSTWQPLSDLGYWPPAAGPNLVTPTFIARMKEADGGLEMWNFAAW